jgi:hypothetical protein
MRPPPAPAAEAARYHRAPMARRLFTLLSALSLLLCAATALLWGRSYRRADFIGYWRPGLEQGYEFTVYEGSSHKGRVGIARFQYPTGEVSGTFGLHVSTLPAEALSSPMNYPHVLGFALERREVAWDAPEHQGVRWWRVSFPYWSLQLVSALPFLVWLWRRLRDRRQQMRLRNTLCTLCGYDLRATPGRCPECGTAAAAQKA